jgi:hypothetical protein
VDDSGPSLHCFFSFLFFGVDLLCVSCGFVATAITTVCCRAVVVAAAAAAASLHKHPLLLLL